MIAPARESVPPLFEFVTPIPYTMLQQMIDDSAPWGILAYEKACYLDELTDDAIAVIAEQLPRKSSPMSIMPIFPMGGAYHDPADDDTAFGGSRASKWLVNIAATAPDPDLLDDRPRVGARLLGRAAAVRERLRQLRQLHRRRRRRRRVRARRTAPRSTTGSRASRRSTTPTTSSTATRTSSPRCRCSGLIQSGTSTTSVPGFQSGSCSTTSPRGSTSAARPGKSSSTVGSRLRRDRDPEAVLARVPAGIGETGGSPPVPARAPLLLGRAPFVEPGRGAEAHERHGAPAGHAGTRGRCGARRRSRPRSACRRARTRCRRPRRGRPPRPRRDGACAARPRRGRPRRAPV